MLLVLLVELLQRGLEQVLAAALLDGLDAGGGRVLIRGVNKISRNFTIFREGTFHLQAVIWSLMVGKYNSCLLACRLASRVTVFK